MSLLKWMARTRARLTVVGIVCLVLLIVGSAWVPDYIRNTSASVLTNLGLMAGWLFLLLLSAISLGILVGDLVFPFHWRRRVVLGEILPPPAEYGAAAAVRATQSHMVPFSVVVVLMLGSGGYLLEGLTGGFFAEYQRIGYFRTVMRTEDTNQKLRLLEEKANVLPEEQRVASVLTQVERIWADPKQPTEVRVAAIRAIGKIADMLFSGLASWRNEGANVDGRWEQRLSAGMRTRLLVPMRAVALAKEDSALKAAAVWALGKLLDRESVPTFAEVVRTEKPGSDSWSMAVHVLGLMQSIKALDVLVEVAPRVRDPKALAHLGWSVAEISKVFEPTRNQAPPPVFGALIKTFGAILSDTRRTVAERCAAAFVLRYVGDTEVAPVLFKGFESATTKDTCQTMTVAVPEGTALSLGSNESLRVLILMAFKYIGKGDSRVIKWTKTMLGRSDVHEDDKHHLTTLCTSASGDGLACKFGCRWAGAGEVRITTPGDATPWTLEGPVTIKGEGRETLPMVPAGRYTITWPNISLKGKLKPGRPLPNLELDRGLVPGAILTFNLKENLGQGFSQPGRADMPRFSRARYAFCGRVASWDDARMACRELAEQKQATAGSGGQLASVEDATANGWIAAQSLKLIGEGQSWIGLKREDGDKAAYSWISGASASYRNWKGGLPQAKGKCVALHPQGGGWSVAACDTPRPFVCRLPSGSVP